MPKTCTRCKKRYPTGLNFYHDKQKVDGLTSHCKRCVRDTRIASYEARRDKALLYSREHYQANKETRKKQATFLRQAVVKQIHAHLGSKCALCGFSNPVALQIDHLDGGGYRHRKVASGGMQYYKEILAGIKNYQILCANCNFIEGVRKGYRKSIWN